MLINRAIPALYNGVSQQPPTLRLPSQAESQINGWSTVVDGLRPRPPLQHVAKLSDDDLSSAHLHVINRTSTQRYNVVIGNGTLQVFDFEGNEKTVTFPNGTTYLDSGNPTEEIACTSVADYTFVVNKTITVALKDVGADLVTQPDNYVAISASIYASYLAAVADNEYGSWYANQYPPNPATSGVLTGTVQSFDYLPGGPQGATGATPSEGDVYKIQGDENSNFTAYYVLYTGGVWNETVALGLQNSLDETTMPWALVHNSDDTFIFQPFSWAPRRVGDETTNPNPSFVGRTINDVFFYQNRLGLLDGENTVCSCAGDFGNYFRLTVVQQLDDSVVDVGGSDTSVTSMNYAVPFATGLMLFSDQTQFRMVTPIDGTFTPTTVSLQVATRYIASPIVRPVMLGSDVYFVSEDDSFAHLREYFVKLSITGQIQTTAEDTTAHVPSYIPKGVYMLSGSLQHDAIFLATSAQPSRVYVYKFYWASEEQKAQSAWGYWELGSGNQMLQSVGLDDYLWCIVKRTDGTFLEKMSLAVGANVGMSDNNGNVFDLLLDRRVSVTGVYTGGASNYTTFTLPYEHQSNAAIVLGPGFDTAGAMLDTSTMTFPTTTTVQVPGDYHAHACFVGQTYTFSYTFSQQFMLNQTGVAVLSGRMTIRNWSLYFTDTAFFKISVDSYGNGNPNVVGFVPDEESEYSGMTVGSEYLIAGSPNFHSGSATFGVFGDSNEATVTISNDTPYSCNFFEAEFEAEYTNRGRTI